VTIGQTCYRQAMRNSLQNDSGPRVSISESHADGAKRQEYLTGAALSHMNDFAYVFNSEGRFLYVNQPLLDLWRRTPEQAAGKNFFELDYPTELAAKLQRQIQEVFDKKAILVDETEYTGADGIPGFYEYIFSPVLRSDGTVEVVVGSTRVITVRKQLELEQKRLMAALSNQYSRLASVIEHAPAFMCTLQGPDYVVDLANKRFHELMGNRAVIGKPLREAVPELQGQGYFELMDDVFRKGDPYIGDEMPMLLKLNGNGSLDRHFVNFVCQSIREADGTISGVLVHGIDVTTTVESRGSASWPTACRRWCG
jgi:PAS domain S-box-containing protein